MEEFDLYKYEHELYDKGLKYIGGVDEVGRGPLVGNVVAACCVLPKNFKGHEAHSQSVLQIPKGAKILAYNEHDEVQSFSYDNHVWGTQFHPEFFSETTKEYLKFEKDKIIGIGKNYENIYNKIQKHKYGEMLLKRFIEIVEENNN